MPSISFATLVFLSLGVAGYAVFAYGTLPLGIAVHPDMRATFQAHAAATYLHIFASALALAIGPFQFSSKLRGARPSLHRWLGRLYLGFGVLAGGLAGLFMAAHAFGGTVARLGFGSLAVIWLYTGLHAYRAIRAGDVVSHRRWMIRNFALTFAAVTLRLYLPIGFIADLPFERTYPLIAWLCWVPNIVVAEWMVRRGRSG